MRISIDDRIQEFLSLPDPGLDWVKQAVRRYHFLPLYLGWIAVLGIRPDRSLVRWDHDHKPEGLSMLTDSYWKRMALCEGAKKYPELASLIPMRPALAVDCNVCHGTGQLGHARVICQCGGLGWVIPGEKRGVSPG